MATTSKGYPYPVGTDRVMDGDNAIQSLAEAVETKTTIKQMKFGVASATTNASGTITITHGLGVVPTVWLVNPVHRTDRIAVGYGPTVTSAILEVTVRNPATASAPVVGSEAVQIAWMVAAT